MSGPMNGNVDGQMDGWMNERIDDDWMDKTRWMDVQYKIKDVWTDLRTDE